ncbi:MAG: hypothetical protein IJC00_03105 [Clostridia bacterium]|nr:hypothetical protein [Clostridia bacterium]
MAEYRKASSVVYYYSRRYHVDEATVWAFLDNLFNIKRGSKAVLDAADRAELRAVFEDYIANREATA